MNYGRHQGPRWQMRPHENLVRRLYALLDAGVATVSVRALLERFESDCDEEALAEEIEYLNRGAA